LTSVQAKEATVGLELADLDERTRILMASEVERDAATGRLYLSGRLSPSGQHRYPDLLRSATHSGDAESLASALRQPGLMNAREISHSKTGKPYEKAVPATAAETLAEGEFNRFYLRGLCLRAIEDGIPSLEIYRAKAVLNPRPDSIARIGQGVDPRYLLEDLRMNPGVDTALGLPPGPNSGLSARIPRASNAS
jgi:hypothetical protein